VGAEQTEGGYPMNDDRWIDEFVKIFAEWAKTYRLDAIWLDFLLWMAIQAGTPYDKDLADQISGKYPDDIVWKFAYLYNKVSVIVKEQPHQNALLKVMHRLGLAERYVYDESSAERKLLDTAKEAYGKAGVNPIHTLMGSQVQNQNSLNDFEKMAMLMGIDAFSVKDIKCSTTYGSFLIAMANVVRNVYPINYPTQVMLIAMDDTENESASALMAFIQMALMGMACYVVLGHTDIQSDGVYHMEYFAPRNAICSPSFYLEDWNSARELTMNVIMRYGVPGNL